ncbi:MAG: hypothetical protein ACN6I3_00640 [bacterium]
MTDTDSPLPAESASASMDDMIVRYDLQQMKEEVKNDFTADSGSHRLLRQADISKRFQRRRANRQAKKSDES